MNFKMIIYLLLTAVFAACSPNEESNALFDQQAKNDIESAADIYFAAHFQDDKPVCFDNEAALNTCRLERNACAFPTGKYKDSYSDEELDRFKACYDQYRSCAARLYNCYGPLKTLKAFVLDTFTDGKELGEIAPGLAWNGRGNMGGVEMADKRCQALADKNKISGKFKAFLSSGKRNFYKEIKSEYLNLPFENVHGTVLTGNIVTLNDLRDSTKNTNDGMWDSVMFFRANKERIKGCFWYFPSGASYDVLTGMDIDGSRSKDNCKNWTNSRFDVDASIAVIFDRGGRLEPVEPVSNTKWSQCYTFGFYNSRSILDPIPRHCNEASDGLFCVQVEK